MSVKDTIGFYPVQGKESTILNSEYAEGHLYFATDTKRIFLDANGKKKMPMGGNSGVYYGKMILEETPDVNQKLFIFKTTDLEINDDASSLTLPNVDDLILNIPDGCFYRVTALSGDSEETEIVTEKLTIAGSSGSSSDGPASLAGLKYDRITPRIINTFANQVCPLKFKVTATNTSGERTGNGTYSLLVNGIEVKSGVCYNNDPNNPDDINIIEDVSMYLGEKDVVTVYVSMDTGGAENVTDRRSWDINTIYMDLIWEHDISQKYSLEELFKLEWEISGGANIEKTINILIDDYYADFYTTTASGTMSKYISPKDLGFRHGIHKIELSLTAQIGDTKLNIGPIKNNIIFAELDNTNYIINYSFDTTKVIDQYDTVLIPIAVYGKNNTGIDIKIQEDEDESGIGLIEKLENGTVVSFPYTPTKAGFRMITLSCGNAGEKVTLLIEVNSIGITIEEVPNYKFKFKASDFTSNNGIIQWTAANKTIKASFSENFDWINGGLKYEYDENNKPIPYVHIKAGTTMSINYNIFGQDARTNGKCFKLIFKTTNCKNYDAQFLTCHDGASGLIMEAQNAYYNTKNLQMDVKYCEDSKIEFELDITSSQNDKCYVIPWIDGVPAGVTLYNKNDDFFIGESDLIIGSPECDVCVYLIKFYEKTLDYDEHLSNFFADALTGTEMVARYRRNDILDSRQEISPSRLAVANPNCLVHVYDVPHMPDGDGKIDGCSYTQYHGSDQVCLSATNVQIKPQGTSSMRYGIAGYNIDAKFKNGFVQNRTTQIDKWSMTPNSIPVDYFCTKVNVASAEGANNALNQEWYNKFQPYQTIAKGKNPKKRDTMEFTPGVLFIKDNNSTTNANGTGDNAFKDTTNYVKQPYPKLYAVCNMGNSKKNIEVFHDLENPLECCIENRDNQQPGQWMTDTYGGYKEGTTFVSVSIDNIDEEATTKCPDGEYRNNRILWETALAKNLYEFRYPDGIDTLKEENPDKANELIEGWFNFVYWMSRSNPSEKYATITFEPIAWFKQNYNTEEAFKAEPEPKYLQDLVTGEYQLVEVFDPAIHAGQTFFIQLTDEKQFQRYEKDLYVLEVADWEEDKEAARNAHLGNYIKIENRENYDPNVTYYHITDHVHGASNEPLKDGPVTYAPYRFTGYTHPNAELQKYQKPSLVAGQTISTYAKTYKYDTTDYRIAKMLTECEQHLCMDSIIFHYLFIERHSMIDNVAKNTFWSTEDGVVWNLTKDYDNDTSDGNDNQGKLTLSYGQEPGDITELGESVFNAAPSVWLNFIRKLDEINAYMYQELENQGAWSSTNYLKAFDEWQSAIPERCWIADFHRKYIRPYEVYNETMYLPMLQGGKKTYQRKQFEIYQEQYISSKYFGKSTNSNSLTTRPKEYLKDYKLPVKMYADCYIQGAFGSGNIPNRKIRCKRNETVIITPPLNLENAIDSTVYLYPANLFYEVGNAVDGLGEFGLAQFTVGTTADKLRSLSLGTRVSPLNLYLDSFGIGNSVNLEELYIANIQHANLTDLDLTKAPSLKILDATNSSFNLIEIADGAPLTTLLLNEPRTLILSNLTRLETLNIQDPSDIDKVDIFKIDASPNVNSKQDIVDLAPVLTQARLREVDWTIDQAKEIQNKKILILEKLLTTDFRDSLGVKVERSQTLSGLLTISKEAFNNNSSIEIYNKYAKPNVYPNLDIIFEGADAKLPKVSIYTGDDTVCWFRRLPVGTTMSPDFLTDGPKGSYSFETMIKKPDSSSHSFIFHNQWNVYDSQGETLKDNDGNDIVIEGENPIYDKPIDDDISLKPVFTPQVRTFTVKFYTYNPATGKIDLEMTDCRREDVPYGIPIKNILPNKIPYKPITSSGNNGKDLKQANDFIGYGLSPQATNPISVNEVINDATENLYAIFKFEEDISTKVHEDWFTYDNFTYQQDQMILQSFEGATYLFPDNRPLNGIQGWVIKPAKQLSGKITIPSVHNGIPVLALSSDFASSEAGQNITHIFCAPKSQLYQINSKAFHENKTLKYFDFSQNTVRCVMDQAFYSCSSLDIAQMSFSTNMYYVGEQGFAGAFTIPNNTIITIPSNVSLVKDKGLGNFGVAAGLNSIGISLEIGSADLPSKLWIAKGYHTGFIQNYIKTFRFWTNNYETLDQYIDDNIQVLQLFVKTTQSIEDFVIEVNKTSKGG